MIVGKRIGCAFNMDIDSMELRSSDGSTCSINTIAMENKIADNMYQRPELDCLIYNAPQLCADLILSGDPELYLKTVAKDTPSF